MKKTKKIMTYDLHERPPLFEWIMLSFQHVFAMFGATVLVPILVNQQAGYEVLTIPVALVSSGVGTLLYLLCTKGKSPVYLGSSFAFITPVAVAYAGGGISGAMTGIMSVGLLYMLISSIIKIAGTKWIDKLLPSIIIGPMIMIIGLGLAPSAIGQMGLSSTLEWENLVISLSTFLITVLVLTKAKGFAKIIPFLIGITSGYIVAMLLGEVDFSVISNASFFSIPNFVIPFRDYDLNFSVLLTILPIALVTMCEHIGDHISLGNIIKKDLVKDPGLSRTILGDGVATFFGGLIGGPANTTYGENTAVVGMSKVSSIYVIALAAIITISIGFLGKLTAIISTIPNAVLGGVSLILYGFIAVNGLKILVENKIDFDNPKNVVIASTMLILGLGGANIVISGVTISGMSLAAICGIVLNFLIVEDVTKKKRGKK
ncbi:MAG: solute carrier family 23 protein [bacterium]